MENERELLELAAKAEGKNIDAETFGEYQDDHRGYVVADGDHWNPLTDDGDALRLAVNLGIAPIQHLEERLCAAHWTDIMCRLESYKDDPYAATRRAIVRAAAELGKQMA